MQTIVRNARNGFVMPRPVTYLLAAKYMINSSHQNAIGCMANDLANCPVSRYQTALLSPQPGHGSPVTITIGQNARKMILAAA